MKLLLITSDVVRNDGQGRVNYEIASAALEFGAQVTLLTTRCATELASHANAKVALLNGLHAPTELLRELLFAVRTLAWVRANARNFDVIHVNGFVSWIRSDVNTVHFVHNAWLRNKWYPFRQWWRKPYFAYQFLFTKANGLLERYAFAHAANVIAVSSTIANELQHIGVPQGKIIVTFNGVDTDEFKPGQGDRNRFGLPTGREIIVLFSGDIKTPRKNLETVIRAVRNVPDAHLAVAGKLEGSPYPLLASDLGMQDRVHFLGFVKDMPLLMRSVDLFVFPSHYEACSLVLIEALASGVPVITARTAGGAELVGEGGRLLNDPNDAETLSLWIGELAADPRLRAEMGRQGREIALKYSWKVMGSAYISLYQSICRKKSRGCC